VKIDQSQKKQFIVLCCLIAVVLTFGAYRIVGMGTHASPRADEPRKADQSPPPEEAAPAEATEEVQAAEPVAEFQTQKARDPFAPQVLPESRRGTPRVSITMPPLMAQGPGLPLPLMSPLTPPAPIRVTPAAPQVQIDPTSELRLTGVIEGTVNIAIIRGAGNARYIVREGQAIDGKYFVTSISRLGVRLSCNGRNYVLRLGGNDATQNGARA